METRFAFLHQRDTSVSMLRVKMSRRRSRSQKENREKVHNLRRRLEDLPEQDSSILQKSVAVHVEVSKTVTVKTDISNAVEERKKMLARYKEAKELQKEKDRREKEKKGVFKCGLYQPRQPAFANPQAPSKAKNPEPVLSTRVTRSMRQPQQTPLQPPQKPAPQKSAPKKEAVVRRPLSTRGLPRIPVAAVPTTASKPKAPAVEPATRSTRPTRAAAAKPVSDAKTGGSKTRSTVKQQKLSSAEQEKEQKDNTKEMPQSNEQKEEESCSVELPQPQPVSVEVEEPVQRVVEAETPAPSSFAPEGFVFQAPAGLLAFPSAPLSPSSASDLAFSRFEAKPVASVTVDPPPPPAKSSSPPSIPTPSSPIPSVSSASSQPPSSPIPSCPDADAATTTAAVTTAVDFESAAPPAVQQEEQHGVPYFRSVLVSETQRLMGLSEQWEVHFDNTSIPEEMRDRMRTAVGQARLLMKERFGQFSGLVDDCEFGRGEKVTTCTDLQGFWDMVYFQVEDVDRKFNALKEAEGRGWTEERKPAPRQKKIVKKPPVAAAASRPGAGAAGNAAAKSRLAAIKAAMKAKQQQAEAEKSAQAAASVQAVTPASATPSKLQPADTVVFNGGFFQVESPLKTAGAVRRSSRLSVVPAASPCPAAASPLTPSRHRRSVAPVHTTPLVRVTPVTTPVHLSNPSPACTPQPSIPPASSSSDDPDPTSFALSFSPERTCPADLSRLSPPPPERSPSPPSESAPALQPSSPPRSTPCLLVSSPSCPTEQCLPTADSHASPRGGGSFMADVDMSASPETPRTDMSGVSMDVPGLDFERYLQVTARVSLSPREDVPTETFSPMAVDTEMESPETLRPDAVLQTPTAPPQMPPLLTPQMDQPVESNLLLFTPELRDRLRQSMCEHDLMSFTPPTHK